MKKKRPPGCSASAANELEKKKEASLLKKVAEQFNDPMILILILGAVISVFLHEVMDSVIIVAVITINALIGVFQEYRAEKALHALEKMTCDESPGQT